MPISYTWSGEELLDNIKWGLCQVNSQQPLPFKNSHPVTGGEHFLVEIPVIYKVAQILHDQWIWESLWYDF